jgi:hypothetical protein
MQKYKTFLLFILILFSCNLLYASSITQRGKISYISLEKRKIDIDITVNNVSLMKQSYRLDFSKVKVWGNNKRIYIGLLKKDMKIEFKTKASKLYLIRVLDSNGHNIDLQD